MTCKYYHPLQQCHAENAWNLKVHLLTSVPLDHHGKYWFFSNHLFEIWNRSLWNEINCYTQLTDMKPSISSLNLWKWVSPTSAWHKIMCQKLDYKNIKYKIAWTKTGKMLAELWHFYKCCHILKCCHTTTESIKSRFPKVLHF